MSPLQRLELLQPVTNGRVSTISELGALVPEAGRECKANELTSHLDFDMRPRAIKESIAIRRADTNAELRSTAPSSNVHERLTCYAGQCNADHH